jgi:transposase
MNNELICGLDVASTSARAALLRSDGVIVRELDVPATLVGEDTLLDALPPDSVVILESTGRYHLRWARRLEAAGHRAYVLNALLAQRLASSVKALRDNKTDPIDARHLAHLGRQYFANLQTYRFRENPARLRLRELCQVRVAQRELLTRTLAAAHDQLYSVLPEAQTLGIHFAQSPRTVALFLHIDSLARLRGLRLPTLTKYLGEKAVACDRMLRQPLSGATMFDAILPALQAQLRLITSLHELLRQLLAAIRTAARESGRRRELALAGSLPGFGEKNTPAIIACLPDGWEQWGDKATTVKKLQAYFGFEPRLRTSGKWEGKVKMSKRGVELARTALYQVSVCALLVDVDLHATYDAQRAAGKSHDVAISHVMRRQLRRLVAVLKNDQPFVEPETYARQAA